MKDVLNIPDIYIFVTTDFVQVAWSNLYSFKPPCISYSIWGHCSRISSSSQKLFQLPILAGEFTNQTKHNYRHRLHDINYSCISQPNPQVYAGSVYNAGVLLNNCRGFVDGTVREELYSDHQNYKKLYRMATTNYMSYLSYVYGLN